MSFEKLAKEYARYLVVNDLIYLYSSPKYVNSLEKTLYINGRYC